MLQVEGISVNIGGMPVLRNVSLEVSEGEFVVILGANGAGKTTLLNTICGLLTPIAGDIRFQGKSLLRLPTHKIMRSGISIAPERGRVFPEMTVRDQIELVVWGSENSAAKRRAIFKSVYQHFPILEERKNQLAGTLSGGERQQLAIARAFASGPKILLLDEPTFGLSPLLSSQVMNLVSTINSEGTGTLLVEQNVHLALQVCHRGYVLEVGQIVLQGSSSALRDSDLVKRAYLGG